MDKLTEDAVREIKQIHSSWIEFEVAGEDHSLMASCADDIAWTRDGGLWVFNTGAMNLGHVIKVDPRTGSRKPWKEIHFDSFSSIQYGVITADGNTFVDTEYSSSGSLRRVYGLR